MLPLEVYRHRLVERRAQADQAKRRFGLIANGRLAVFGIGILIGILAFGFKLLSPWWLCLPGLTFVVLLILHDQAGRRREKAERAASFYERGIERLEDRWVGKGVTGERYQDANHPYAADLDILGAGSLYERLCTARTPTGQETLARWLLGPAEPEVVRARQQAVLELRPLLDLREDLAVLGPEVDTRLSPSALTRWANEPIQLRMLWPRIVLEILSALALASLIGWVGLELGYLPLVAIASAEGLFALAFRGRVTRVIAGIDRTVQDLELLAELLERIESLPLNSSRLRALQTELLADGVLPSRRIAHLVILLHWLDARRNQFFLPIALLTLWTTRLAFAIDRWRVRSGPAVARWLAVVGEFEALLALAGYSFENPEDIFPEIADHGPKFEAQSLGHPLLPRKVCVRNDIQLGEPLRVLIVSGSNMSGKSTMLRTVGINAVLALAGAPVRASQLRLSLLSIGATLRIQDSLQAGKSRFYAEITRVRQLVELAEGPRPLLFLLDEIFAGTNSHDRCIGAQAIIRGLVERGAIGLATTHDLALADIANSLSPRAANVHFADHLENGELRFDYRMRPGVVTHSNALALMRAVGLEV
jgi:hypothetical protein